jgi:hypothetical protein
MREYRATENAEDSRQFRELDSHQLGFVLWGQLRARASADEANEPDVALRYPAREKCAREHRSKFSSRRFGCEQNPGKRCTFNGNGCAATLRDSG